MSATIHFRFCPCYTPTDLHTPAPPAAAAETPATARSFHPLYLHHFFSKQVLQKSLWPPDYYVNIYYIPSTLDIYVEEEGTVPVNPEGESEGSQWVINSLSNVEGYPYPGGFISNKEEFLELVKKFVLARSMKPNEAEAAATVTEKDFSVHSGRRQPLVEIPGTILARCTTSGGQHLWLAECVVPLGAEEKSGGFPMLHRRIEWFMHFYIDALSRIELDSRWRFFLVLKFGAVDPLEIMRRDIVKSTEATQPIPNSDIFNQIIRKPVHPAEIVGLVTVYQFFCLPRDRARISQFFMFPSQQRQGVGRTVLHALLDIFSADPNIRQYTVEDPAPGFKRLRDLVCCERAIEQKLLSPEVFECISECKSAPIPWEQHPANRKSGEWAKYSKVFKEEMLENGFQRERIRLLLELARYIPQSVLDSTTEDSRHDGTPVGKRRKVNATGGLPAIAVPSPGALIQWASKSPEVTAVRVRHKRKLRLESLEWYTQPRMGLSDVHNGLEEEWREIFLSLCATIRRIRKPPTTTTD